MIVAGLAGTHALTAAICLDGTIVAIVGETVVPPRDEAQPDREQRVIRDALTAAGLAPDRPVDACARVGREGLTPAQAQATLAAATLTTDAVVVIADEGGPPFGMFERRGTTIRRVGEVPGGATLLEAATAIARVVGTAGQVPDAIDVLDALARGRAEDEVPPGLRLDGLEDPARAGDVLASVLAEATALSPVPLDDPQSPHRVAQRVRGQLAASWFDALAAAVARAAADGLRESGLGAAVAGGSLVRAASLRQRLPAELQVAPLFDAAGDAAGAACAACLARGITPVVPASLQLGHAFTEADIKQVLENCRLDFLYEPAWGRLIERVSTLLERGLVVAWFQGRGEAGQCALGARGVLADPSLRYTRDNINQYLLGRELAHPLPLSVLASVLNDALPDAAPASAGLGRWRRSPVPAWCVAAAEPGGWIGYQSVDAATSPALHDLLACHHARTGTPGLINIPAALLGQGAHPRDAVATMFSHAIDALVIGRFVIMKDVWLLRTTTR